jgi:hypothetical protein
VVLRSDFAEDEPKIAEDKTNDHAAANVPTRARHRD